MPLFIFMFCVIFLSFSLHVFSLFWSMTSISLAQAMSSPMIILLPSWHLWGCLFNPTNVRLGLHLAYLLDLSPLLNFIVPLVASRSLASLLVLFPLPFFFFLHKALGKDVQHANVFPKLGDILVAFIILFQCFT